MAYSTPLKIQRRRRNIQQTSTRPAVSNAHRAGQGRKSGLLSTVLNGAERVAELLPGAIRTVRNFTGKSAVTSGQVANFATPASFATITNNPTGMSEEQKVRHPSLGLTGVSYTISQPMAGVWPGIPAVGVINFWQPNTSGSPIHAFAYGDTNTIGFSPRMWGGPLSVEANLYSNYVVREMSLEFTSAVATTYVGDCSIGIEADPSPYSTTPGDGITSTTFDECRMLAPVVVGPYRVPSMQLLYKYDGPTLYNCEAQRLTTVTASDARGSYQFLVKGFDSGLVIASTPNATMYTQVKLKIEFYNRIPPLVLLGGSIEERMALDLIRDHFRQLRRMRCTVPAGKALLPRLGSLLGELLPSTEDSCARPVRSPDPILLAFERYLTTQAGAGSN